MTFFFMFMYSRCQLWTKKLQADMSCCPALSTSKLDFRHYKF